MWPKLHHCFSPPDRVEWNFISRYVARAPELPDLSANLIEVPTTASPTAPIHTGPAAPDSSSGGPSTTPSPSPVLSIGDKAGIVVPLVALAVACLAIVVGMIVGWWKKHQVLWLVTCGRRGCKKTVKPQRAPQETLQLASLGIGDTGGVGNGDNSSVGNGDTNNCGR